MIEERNKSDLLNEYEDLGEYPFCDDYADDDLFFGVWPKDGSNDDIDDFGYF